MRALIIELCKPVLYLGNPYSASLRGSDWVLSPKAVLGRCRGHVVSGNAPEGHDKRNKGENPMKSPISQAAALCDLAFDIGIKRGLKFRDVRNIALPDLGGGVRLVLIKGLA